MDATAPTVTPATAPPAGAFDPKDFRRALGMFATGVAIVTPTTAGGAPRGVSGRMASVWSISPRYICQPVSPCCAGASPLMKVVIAVAVVATATTLRQTPCMTKPYSSCWKAAAHRSPLYSAS